MLTGVALLDIPGNTSRVSVRLGLGSCLLMLVSGTFHLFHSIVYGSNGHTPHRYLKGGTLQDVGDTSHHSSRIALSYPSSMFHRK